MDHRSFELYFNYRLCEPGTFVEGEIADNQPDDKNKYSSPTYVPGNNRITLTSHGISLNGLFSEGAPFNDVYNFKVINTFLQNKITNEYLKSLNKRPFILSRSSFVGMGRYANHWLGDNFSTWESMKASISGIFNFQLFGFNLVGADICGFLNNTTDTLCARWSTLGAFYPFSRNHNNKGSIDQEPWAVGQLTLNANKQAIKLRYSILRYLYTHMYISSIYGGMVYQPLFIRFPKYNELLLDESAVNYQIMIGPALLYSPALEESTDTYRRLFPPSNWISFPSGDGFLSKSDFEKIVPKKSR